MKHWFRLGLIASLASLSGCTALGPMATWEVVKWGGSMAISHQDAKPVNTVHHGDAPVKDVCVEYNRDMPLDELVPALQAELKSQGVQSRVYDAGTGPNSCTHWLRYVGSIEWGTPPLSQQQRPYLSSAALSLRDADGRLLSSSAYISESSGARWSSTRKKIAPVVKALITGFET
ncbi:cell division protein FtsI [Pelomonas cellulosilytica]|uniref:Cell division protein FtsI n=1 Tax=Pelomonas cellulosilytica TaxID=2906762 RepID=A0ABS8XVR1_9BURK|nr:cell division protein FtsI [Pelomonas sp. P8]MCE4554721.1 cell division protein FtsI [Pelomonas sp. P8]